MDGADYGKILLDVDDCRIFSSVSECYLFIYLNLEYVNYDAFKTQYK
jgi:hypothetical protein